MFPGDPYARQERHRAEQEERDRVLRLVRQRKERIAGLSGPRRNRREWLAPEARAAYEELEALELAVRQGWQRIV